MADKLGRQLGGRAERAQSAWSSAGLTGRRLVDAVPLRYNNNNNSRSKNNSKNSRTHRPSSLGTGESIRTSTIAVAGTIAGGEEGGDG